MLMETARKLGKRLLHRTPLRHAAKKVWNHFKFISDRRAFRQRYPFAEYVLYPEAEIAGLKPQGFQSQYGQDHYLWTRFLETRGSGSFVDIGANVPLQNSNSHFLEQRGWHGFAIDPMRSLAALWASHRKATFLNVAISSMAETRTFIEIQPRTGWEHMLSGFKGFVRPEDLAIYDSIEYEVPCLPLSQALPAGFVPDLLLIDVEGAERFVIEGLDFGKVRPEFILCENNGEIGGRNDQRLMIERLGYTLIARIGASDDLFRRTD